ncbi:MAG: Ni/Fe-hydrogenase cytochrome b subunit [Candidatus Caldarchaeum sp.]|uniref:Ni/Fe-hydrogenase cytochrome b subunit n=1 Tax=Caldiarchaeum subterraneum TaxID=311458 RepID=A0A7C5L850_CALS0
MQSLKTSKPFAAWVTALLAVIVVGAYAAYLRMTVGFKVTALSDYYPWGLWTGFDVLSGVALASGAFTLALVVYLLRVERFKPIIRPTILTGFLGYLMVVLGLIFDIAQPERWWHPLYPLFWQPRSVLFEVYWCVFLYTIVLTIEFSPALFERLGWSSVLNILRKITIPVVIAGVILSTLHQSSLGALYTISPEHVHPLWYSPLLPVLFFTSAVAVAPAMIIFESTLSAKATKRGLEHGLLKSLAKAAPAILLVYLVMRFADIAYGGASAYMLDGVRALFFWGEVGLGFILPMILLAVPRVRESASSLFIASLFIIGGVVANRVNTVTTAWIVPEGVVYFPTWAEFAITFMILAVGMLAFTLAIKLLPVFPEREKIRVEAAVSVKRG